MKVILSFFKFTGERNSPTSILPQFAGDVGNSTSSTNIPNFGPGNIVQDRNRNKNGAGKLAGGGTFVDVDLGDQMPSNSDNPATTKGKVILKASFLFRIMAKGILKTFNLFKVIVVEFLSIIFRLALRAWLAIRGALTVFTSLLLAAVASIIFGPELNADHRLLYMSEEALNYCWASANILWLLLFIVYLTSGPWSILQGFQGTCHRIICIICVILPLLLKMFEPKQIPISFCPAFFTLVVELTGQFIKLTTQVVQGAGGSLVRFGTRW